MTKTSEDLIPLTLEEVAPRLGEAYKGWKESEKAKNDRKIEFFTLADEALDLRGSAMKVVDMEASSEEVARERVTRHYPGWVIEIIRRSPVSTKIYEVVVHEDLSVKSFSFEHEGIKYSRTVSKGPVMVDDEWLQEADPDLYEEVTFELPWGDRITRPVERMDKEALGKLAKYIYNGPPRVALGAPRPVKAES